MKAAIAAIQHVHGELKVTPNNRKDETGFGASMTDLEAKKTELRNARLESKEQKRKELTNDQGVLDLQIGMLSKDQEKLVQSMQGKSKPDQTEIQRQIRSVMQQKMQVIDKRNKLDREIEGLLDVTIMEDIEITAEAARDVHKGNCDEMSSLAYLHIRSSTDCRPLELLSTEENSAKDQHQFVVIGRDPDSLLNDPSDWGEDAVICDVWDNKVYAPDQLSRTLQALGYPCRFSIRAQEG